MKKKIVSLALSLSTIFTIAAGNTMNASASCSGWTREPGWYVSCDWSDRCGIAWAFPGTCYEVGTKVRYCDKNGRQVKETSSFYERNGCCA